MEEDDPQLAAADALEAAAEQVDAVSADAAAAAALEHGRVGLAWLAPEQQLRDECGYPSLTLSALAHEGDYAFVDVDLVGAPLAGIGDTWALQRRGAHWVVVARRRNWIA